MNLYIHLSIHILLSLLAGFLVFLIWKKPGVSFLAATLGGVLVDLDHLIDYFLAFGTDFRPDYFLQGYQFLKSGKVYILFHGWEYGIVLIFLAIWVFKNRARKTAASALALGLFFHLAADSFINEGAKLSTYSILYRLKNNFEIRRLVTPEHWESHLQEKTITEFED